VGANGAESAEKPNLLKNCFSGCVGLTCCRFCFCFCSCSCSWPLPGGMLWPFRWRFCVCVHSVIKTTFYYLMSVAPSRTPTPIPNSTSAQLLFLCRNWKKCASKNKFCPFTTTIWEVPPSPRQTIKSWACLHLTAAKSHKIVH